METDNSSESETPRETVEPSSLTSLYPRQKTYEELYEKRQRLIEFRRSLRPKYTLLTAGLALAVILAISLNVYSVVSRVFELLGVMSGVFFAFFLGLILFGLIVWQFKRVRSYFVDRGITSFWFFSFYIVTLLATIWVYVSLPGGQSFPSSIILSLTHYSIATAFGSLYVKLRATD